MPASHQLRKTANERLAREEALHTHVYISGLSGHHTLETGLAYYYRGHYIYAYPAGNLIEPIPYSTRKGIMIQGILSESAPMYDRNMEGLVDEDSIQALVKSVTWERHSNKTDYSTNDSISPTSDQETTFSTTPPSPVRAQSAEPEKSDTPSLTLLQPPLSNTSRVSSLTSLTALRDTASSIFTPQPGLAFLAASAPGSRLASRSASPSGLRTTSSHIGLSRLQGGRQGSHRWIFEAEAADSLVERTSSRLGGVDEGREREGKVGYLPGLCDHALDTGMQDLRFVQVVPPTSNTAIIYNGNREGENSTNGTRIKPCAIHGEDCDGVATARSWDTEEMRLGRGFVEDVPMVNFEGRVMVDWAGLLEEARSGGGSGL